MNESQTSKSPWGGWLLHAVIGAGVTAVLAWLGAPPVAVLAAVLAMGKRASLSLRCVSGIIVLTKVVARLTRLLKA